MLNLHTVLTILLLIPINPVEKKKQDISDMLLGTWVHEQKANKDLLRFVKADSFNLNTRGFTFHKNGKVTIYSEFGCQLPPHFRENSADWEVTGKRTVSIDTHFPGEKPREMRIEKLGKRELLFSWR
jgi:hypothetical protein